MRFSRVLLVCGFTLATLGVTSVSSYSLEQAPPVKYAITADRCLALLDEVPPVDVATSQSSSNLRTKVVARQTAMGLMLGLRSAVGPREGSGLKHKVNGVDSERAQAIARYRHCRSQQTLESFASN